MSMITIRNLQFQYDAAPEINALYGIDLEIRKGECVILTGESGCGKTTLTRCLNGLIPNFFEGTLQSLHSLQERNINLCFLFRNY